MASGIMPTPEAQDFFESDVKKRNGKHYAAFFKIAKNAAGVEEIVVDTDRCLARADAKDGYEHKTVCDQFPADGACFAIVNFPNNLGNEQLIIVSWVPDNCAVREKMKAASSFMKLKETFNVTKYLQANDFGDLSEDAFKKIAN
mmetsp:Transcript_25590/g.46189  ORF Transcript_25590/g.46189 Transcript_25590/m.46189 type:complete len:144 (-) Transcript_25590:95-526(-)|eukprot:CAMPEP_0202495212 /NCGR_PEP_ID=MMETSP1361-20130828/15635_1 /ASSEMBLY_ACC=CAM_ASM_000849 /TAXON_ID=210615 /ORGANISM="Staurosira complex sp., Strain CCMP2646" /LENGTH=143 /DNA_ID=CAMNT_0049126133 /DNA_START=27 /DNA_END=458 /DNA_ORIENTATION=-